ncbi:MAG TPA: DNA repair protein RecN [Pseudobdellovibrionaceae bacterium]|nr:DNA repair protein RecN [Pseudobdellovibrionaceae bacterium]
MLIELKVSQFAIIENIHVIFKNGLNILSGETGAGKSVLLKSLALLMGDKTSSQMVRTGHDQAIVEGLFDVSERQDILSRLKEMGISTEESQLLIRRLIRNDDRSRVYINGQLSSLTDLRSIVSPLIEVAGHAPLIEMTGQHENKNLTSKSYHLDILDIFAENGKLRSQYEKIYRQHRDLEKKIQLLKSGIPGSSQRLDYLEFQKNEIERLELAPGEEEKLESEYKNLKSFHKMSDFVEGAELTLDSSEDSVFDRLKSLIKRAYELNPSSPEVQQFVEKLEEAKSILGESLFNLSRSFGNTDFSAERMEEIESRLSDLRKAQKKFGATSTQILQSLEKIKSEIGEIKNIEESILNSENNLKVFEIELKSVGKKLHARRLTSSQELSEKVNKELRDLNMKGVQFSIDVQIIESMNPTGFSEVQFLIQSSSKDQPRPLGKVASGGELSRILLSLKKVIGLNDQPRTYLFDEVDTGVSGETAHKVGLKLSQIAKGQQVICVTHLPQVAVYAHTHFNIHKKQKSGNVQMEVSELSGEERIQEIARLLSGEKITSSSLENARELMSTAF